MIFQSITASIFDWLAICLGLIDSNACFKNAKSRLDLLILIHLTVFKQTRVKEITLLLYDLGLKML